MKAEMFFYLSASNAWEVYKQIKIKILILIQIQIQKNEYHIWDIGKAVDKSGD